MMKRTVWPLAALCLAVWMLLAQHLNAQSANREFGIRFNSLNGFDLVYKKEKSETKWRRYRLGASNFQYQRNDSINKNWQVNLELAVGCETRERIADRAVFYHGFEPRVGFSFYSNAYSKQTTISPGIGYVLGFLYDLSPRAWVGIEAIPAVYSTFTLEKYGESSTAFNNAGFSLNSLAIAIAYRF